jgi:hypothetical protein
MHASNLTVSNRQNDRSLYEFCIETAQLVKGV